MWSPTSSMSVVRKLFWLLVSRLEGGVCSPMKKGLKGTMPALVNSRVGSPAGINEAEGICWWPLPSKNFMKESLIWSPFIGFLSVFLVYSVLIGWFSRGIPTGPRPARRRKGVPKVTDFAHLRG